MASTMFRSVSSDIGECSISTHKKVKSERRAECRHFEVAGGDGERQHKFTRLRAGTGPDYATAVLA